MQLDVIRSIGEIVGKVEEVEVNENGSCVGQFARVRISRELALPLQRCVSIAMEGEEEQCIALIRYERLSDFCYACGRVGHVVRHCDDLEVDKVNHEYGQWLRANRVLEGRRQRRGMAGSRPRRDVSNSSPQPTESESGYFVFEGSKASEEEALGMRHDDNLQIVLVQEEEMKEDKGQENRVEEGGKKDERRGGEENVRGMETWKEINEVEGGSPDDTLLLSQSGWEVGQTVDEVLSGVITDSGGGKGKEAGGNMTGDLEKRWKKRARKSGIMKGGSELVQNKENKRKERLDERPLSMPKRPRQNNDGAAIQAGYTTAEAAAQPRRHQ